MSSKRAIVTSPLQLTTPYITREEAAANQYATTLYPDASMPISKYCAAEDFLAGVDWLREDQAARKQSTSSLRALTFKLFSYQLTIFLTKAVDS